MRLKIDLIPAVKVCELQVDIPVSSPLKSGSKETWIRKKPFLPPETKGPGAPGPGSVVLRAQEPQGQALL